MAYSVEYSETARRQLKKLDRAIARRILDYLEERVANKDPRNLGKRLAGPLSEFWRYRVGDYRVIVHIEDERLVVLVVQIGHRREVYK